jgi:ParB-like chromosome segregation protein Spo0J
MDWHHPGENASMTDVPIYVAVITAAAGVGGAALPSVATIIRDVKQAGRDRHDRQAETKRQACLDLLGAASELRARVANTADYHGDEIGDRLAQIRESEAAIHLHAAAVALLAPENLAEPADLVARAATRLVMAAEEKVDPNAKQMVTKPDFKEFDKSVEAFRDKAVADARALR